MSKRDVLPNLPCPRCGHTQDVKVWTSVNATLDPSLKQLLLSGRLNLFVCPKCRLVDIPPIDVLYHDMEYPCAIWIRHPNESGRVAPPEGSEGMFQVLNRQYVCRVVAGYPDLVEKVLILDDGYSDFEVELFKLMVCMKRGIDTTEPFYYAETKRGVFRGPHLGFALPNLAPKGIRFGEREFREAVQRAPTGPR